MKVRYTATAIAEIENVFSYINADNPNAAGRVMLQVEHTISLIAQLPKIGPVKHRGTLRMLPVRRFPQYLLFYSVEDSDIVVHGLRHSARRRPWDDNP